MEHPSRSGPPLLGLREAGIPTAGQLMELVGTRLDNPAAQLGLRSTRVMSHVLKRKERNRRQDSVSLITSLVGPRSSAGF